MARFFRHLGGWLIGIGALGLVGLVVIVVFIASNHSSSASNAAKPAGPASLAPTPVMPQPVGFQPLAATFVSGDEGWVLGTVLPCGSPLCPAIQHTTDGGHTWKLTPTPPLSPGKTPETPTVRFADSHNGWIVSNRVLWSTHDGGATWHQVTLPTAVGDDIDLRTASGMVRVATVDSDGLVIMSSPVASDNWSTSRVTLQLGGGPKSSATMLLLGNAGWVVVNNRVAVAGAQLFSGRWSSWNPPCLHAAGPAQGLDAVSADDLIALCDVGRQSQAGGERVYTSADGGDSFSEAATVSPDTASAGLIGAATTSDMVVSVHNKLMTSLDGGRHWTPTYTGKDTASFGASGFTTASEGFTIEFDVVPGTPGPWPSRLLMTHDGGRSWTPTNFAG